MNSFQIKVLRVEEYRYEVEAVNPEEARAAAESYCHEPMEGDPYPNAVGGSITLAQAVTAITPLG